MSNPVVHTAPCDRIVCYLATRNLYDMLPAAYNSLLYHNPDVRVYLLIEDDTLPFWLPQQVSCVNVSGQEFFPESGPNFHSQYSYMALMKAALPYIFPDAPHLVVLDVDTVVCDNLSPLWDEYPLDDACFAAVPEPRLSAKYGKPYPNFGMVSLNLSLLRSSGIAKNAIAELNTRYHPYPEQDTLSELCDAYWIQLPVEYNATQGVTGITGSSDRPRVVHFAGVQNWWVFDIVQRWTLYTVLRPLTVVYIGNRKVYNMMLASAKSLLYHSPVDRIYFLIEDDSFPEPLPDIFTCINVSGQQIFHQNGPNISGFYSYMTALRAALTKLLPGCDRVLLLDPDTIVYDDISPVWNYDISDYYFAAVQETRNNDHVPPYYNAGVMLLNLRKLREDGMDDRIISEINTTHYKHLEQDVMNFLCAGHILDLPSAYNASFVSDPARFPRIMHFLSHAKRFFPEAARPYESLDWKNIPFAQKRGDTLETL